MTDTAIEAANDCCRLVMAEEARVARPERLLSLSGVSAAVASWFDRGPKSDARNELYTHQAIGDSWRLK